MEPCSASQDSTTACRASETLSLMVEPSAKAMNFTFLIKSLLSIIVVRASPSLQLASTDGRGSATSFVSCFVELDFRYLSLKPMHLLYSCLPYSYN